ncbi:MAG: hypothetical protein KF852_19945 [Saprospiraceae bacterium]|nr:hypothetical protein [Saprospiraceae bacterium]
MIRFFTCLSAAMLLFSATAFAQQPTFTVSPQSVNATVDQQFSVNVTVSNFSNIASMQFSMEWNASVIEFLSVSNINSAVVPGFNASSFGLPGTGSIPAGRLSVSWFNDTFTGINLPNGTILYTLNFRAAAAGTSNIAFGGMPTSIEILNGMFTNVGLNPQNGTVTVTGGGGGNPTDDFTLTIASASNVMNGQQVCLNVTAQNFTNIIGMQFSINYNPAMLQYVSVGNFNLQGLAASNFGVPGAGGTSPGTITLSWTDPDLGGETLANGATVFQLCFTALTGSGSTQVTFGNTPTAIEIINSAGRDGSVQQRAGHSEFCRRWRWRQPDWFHVDDCECEQCDERAAGVPQRNGAEFHQHHRDAVFDQLQPGDVAVHIGNDLNLQGLAASNFGVPGAGGTSPGTITLSWTDPDHGWRDAG